MKSVRFKIYERKESSLWSKFFSMIQSVKEVYNPFDRQVVDIWVMIEGRRLAVASI